ncbi:MAG: glycosyltransferase [Pseudomonadota bacterium]
MTDTPHILFHRPTLWSSPVQCSTKTLARLSAEEGCKVTYLQAPLDPIHLFRAKGYAQEWKNTPRIESGVRVITPATVIPVRDIWPLNSKRASFLRYRLCSPSIRSLSRSGVRKEPDIVWTTVPGSAPALRRCFPNATLVFHVIDYYPAFRGEAVKALERADYAICDHVYLIGESMVDYLVAELGVSRGKITVLGQGVDNQLYENPSDETRAALADLPHPRAIWTGVLAKGDAAMFSSVAEALRLQSGSLVLIGPSAAWAEALARAYPGVVHLLGPKPAAEIPHYLQAADIGLMLYDQKRGSVYKGQNPLKMYEYAAAGLSIVSTWHEEFAFSSPPVRIVRSTEEASAALTEIAAIDKAIARQQSKDFARKNDWRAKVKLLLKDLLSDRSASHG